MQDEYLGGKAPKKVDSKRLKKNSLDNKKLTTLFISGGYKKNSLTFP